MAQTIDELIRQLESVRDDFGPDTPVLVCIQPSWPLVLELQTVIAVNENEPTETEEQELAESGEEPECDEPEVMVCFLIVSDSHPDDRSPYGEKKWFNR